MIMYLTPEENGEPTNSPTKENKYSFKIYTGDGEKVHTDFYTKEGALEMKRRLDKNKEVYSIILWDYKINRGDEVNRIN